MPAPRFSTRSTTQPVRSAASVVEIAGEAMVTSLSGRRTVVYRSSPLVARSANHMPIVTRKLTMKITIGLCRKAFFQKSCGLMTLQEIIVQ